MVEEPTTILESETKQLHKKRVKLVKILLKNKHGRDMNWELEDEMRASYPYMFITVPNFGKKLLKEGRIVMIQNSHPPARLVSVN